MQADIVPIPSQADLKVVMQNMSNFFLDMINSTNPNQQHSLGMLLLAATMVDDIAAVRSVLDSQLPILDSYGCAAAMNAAGMGYVDLVKLLYERHPAWFTHPWYENNKLVYPIELAALRQQGEVVEYLLPNTSLEILNNPGWTSAMGVKPPLLIGLVKCRFTDMLKLILTRKPNLEIRSSENHTPLLQACFEGDFDSAKLLVAAGAEVNIVTKNPRASGSSSHPANMFITQMLGNVSMELSPLQFAAASGDPRLVYLLLQAGANVNVNSMHGTPLHLAARAEPINTDRPFLDPDYSNVVRLLLMHKAEVRAVHSLSQETALHLACQSSQADIAKQLLLADASPYAEDMKGNSCIPALQKMGIMHAENSSDDRLAQRKLKMKKDAETGCRKDLIEALKSGRYRIKQLMLKPEASTDQTVLATKKKKKNNKKKKKSVTANAPKPEMNLTVSAVASPSLAPSPVIVTEMPNANLDTLPITIVDVPKTASAVSPASEKFPSKKKQAAIIIPPSIFKPDIPYGDTYQKFPLQIEGVRAIHYFVNLIPNMLNAMFGSERTAELNKVWAAITIGRLLLPKSKGTSGVKCLSLQEMGRFKNGFFKNATHKVKPNREDTRVYLESKLVTENSKSEFHLELIGTNFSAHK